MTDDDPRRFGKALRHDLSGLWRYRIKYLVIPESPEDLSGIQCLQTVAWIPDNRFAVSGMTNYVDGTAVNSLHDIATGRQFHIYVLIMHIYMYENYIKHR